MVQSIFPFKSDDLAHRLPKQGEGTVASIDDSTTQSLWGNVQVAIQFCIHPDVALKNCSAVLHMLSGKGGPDAA
jgi:hypothetical protein